MAHQITQRANGKSEMAYVGEKPWHGLGQKLLPGTSIEDWQKAAGMDWKIQRSKVRYAADADRTVNLREWDEYHVLMRSDTKAPLGMVSDRFKVVQPKEVLEFFRDLVEVAGFTLETAGTLYGGKKFWALANIKAEDRIVGKDLVKGKLLFATSCDGSMKTIVNNVAERVVCDNTLRIALGESGAAEMAISHRSTFNAEKVKKQLGIAVGSFEKFIMQARTLATCKVSDKQAQDFIYKLVRTGDEKETPEFVAGKDAFLTMMALFNGKGKGSTLPGAAGTAWGLLNAATEYHDHHRYARTDSGKLNHAWFGSGDTIKQRALEQALALAK